MNPFSSDKPDFPLGLRSVMLPIGFHLTIPPRLSQVYFEYSTGNSTRQCGWNQKKCWNQNQLPHPQDTSDQHSIPSLPYSHITGVRVCYIPSLLLRTPWRSQISPLLLHCLLHRECLQTHTTLKYVEVTLLFKMSILQVRTAFYLPPLECRELTIGMTSQTAVRQKKLITIWRLNVVKRLSILKNLCHLLALGILSWVVKR